MLVAAVLQSSGCVRRRSVPADHRRQRPDGVVYGAQQSGRHRASEDVDTGPGRAVELVAGAAGGGERESWVVGCRGRDGG